MGGEDKRKLSYSRIQDAHQFGVGAVIEFVSLASLAQYGGL
jgi:hypothetical protein